MVIACGCAPPSLGSGFDAADPANRIQAIERAAREGDTTAVPRIIEQLDSDDPAIRLVAITALERLTGRTNGYRFDDPRPERDEAVRTWVEWARTEGTGPPDGAERHG